MSTQPTGGIKYDHEKVRWDLLPLGALEEVAKLLTFGAKKYQAWNWYTGLSYSRCFAAAMRHIKRFMWDREEYDEESQCHHLAAFTFYGLVMLTFALERRIQEDDRIFLCTPHETEHIVN